MKSGLILSLMLLTLAACNTVEGVGRDISGAGQAISGASSNTKQKMSR